MPRIGVLLVGSKERLATTRVLKAFQQGLQEHGYVEGKNLIIEWRGAEGKLDRLPALAAELVVLKVDLIVAAETNVARALKETGTSIPVVFVQSADPVREGLTKSLARPGGNMTGLTNFSDEAIVKQLELLTELVPRLSRLAIIHNPGDFFSVAQLEALRAASAKLKLNFRVYEVGNEKQLESAFRAIEQDRPEALHAFFNTVTYIHLKRIAQFALELRLPAICGFDEFVNAGGLISYWISIADSYRRSAVYVDRILKGIKPADLPVERPNKLELVINLKTAKAIGLKIPKSVLLRAERVVE